MALPLMPGGGTIILTGSDVSIKGYPSQGVYPATKAAVRSFARTWTTDLKDRGIRVNVVSPGPVDTAMLTGHPQGTVMPSCQPEGMEVVVSRVSMGRMGRPEEMAKTVTFLASDDASFITGDEVFVDGGNAQV
jgi:NAD(P)-dependent dehydrogenase (short-subunit alcohol dehydrogenase family)